ncbi:MAG: spore cortex biosynthesis protein YabQ [Clostridia bacterium]|nr:spore cortex biosynthesis protein YabQ [Clostridia bacterium]
MEYLPDTAYRAAGFFYSAGLGFALGIVYDLFRLFLFVITGSDKKFAVAGDIIYMLFSLFATFVLLLVRFGGEVSFYAIAGEAAGAMIYGLTLRSLIFARVKRTVKKIRRIFALFGKKTAAFFKKAAALIQKSGFSFKKHEKTL